MPKIIFQPLMICNPPITNEPELKGKASFIDCFCFFRATLFMANIQSCFKNASKIKKEQMQSTPPFFDIPILKKLLNYMLHHKVLYCDGLCC